MKELPRKTWVMRLPRGLRDQPAWFFIGMLTSLAGLTYLLGLSTSVVAQVLNSGWLRSWGGFLFVAGMLVVFSTIMANKPLERLALRFLSLGFLVYLGWILQAVSWQRATITAIMCLALIASAEVRIAVIKRLLKPLPAAVKKVVK